MPPAIAAIMAAPLASFPYLLDDFEFFARTERLQLQTLLPDPSSLFYRPVSREIYFGVLGRLGAGEPLWGHLANAALLVLATFLLASLAARIAGERAGLFAGILFSGLGALPVLVGWTSGAQDLLAIVFVLAALLFQLRGARAAALAAAAFALLSKETSAAFFPAFVLLPLLARQGKERLRGDAIAFGILMAAWTAIHPSLGHVLTHRMESSGQSGGYLSLSAANAGPSIVNSAAALANLPMPGASIRWPVALLPCLAGAILFAGFGAWKSRADRGATSGAFASSRSILLLALLLSVPPLLLSAVLVRDWMPYYVVIASLGTSLAVGAWISTLGLWPSIVLVALALGLGVTTRGQDLGPKILTESSLTSTADELDRLEAAFRSLMPGVGARRPVVCMIQAPPGGTSYIHLFRFQVLRFWFGNSGIDAIHPEWRRPRPAEEHLVFVGDDQTVYEINTRTFQIRASMANAPPFPLHSVLRSYAQGLALSGEIDRAVGLLLALPEDEPHVANMNRRLAAAYLLALGRERDAEELLRSLPPFAPRDAAEVSAAFLANPARIDLDHAVMSAMGVNPNDPRPLRFIMQWMVRNGSGFSAARIARKLLQVVPGDSEARGVIGAEEGVRVENVLTPATPDSLW